MGLLEQFMEYKPFNAQEDKDKALIIACLKDIGNIFCRQNALAHMTASAWVVNRGRNKALLAYHTIYQSWAWLGGHADGERDLLQVALREVAEESGLKSVRPVSDQIFSLEALTVNGHVKRGEYISSHLHLNVTYLLEAEEHEALSIKPDENSGVAWFSFEDVMRASSEEWIKTHIYKKLIAKLNTGVPWRA